MQATSKLRAYIGFSIRARKIVYGYDAVVRNKSVRLVLASASINRTAKNELQQHCEQHNVPLHWCDDQLLVDCTAREGCKCIGLVDASLAHAAHEELNNMRKGEPK